MKFTKGEQNLATKYGLDLSKNDDVPMFAAMNPFSGDTVTLNALHYKIYAVVMSLYKEYLNGNGKVVGEYDRLKYLFLKLNSDAYMRLID